MGRRSGAIKAVRPGMVLGAVLLRDDQTDFATRKGRPTRFSAAAPLIHDSPAESLAVEPKRRVVRPRRDEQMVESVGCHFVAALRSALRRHENNTAARDSDAEANSSVRPKVRRPRGLSQRNISRTRK